MAGPHILLPRISSGNILRYRASGPARRSSWRRHRSVSTLAAHPSLLGSERADSDATQGAAPGGYRAHITNLNAYHLKAAALQQRCACARHSSRKTGGSIVASLARIFACPSGF